MVPMKKHLVFHRYRGLIQPGLLGNYNGCEIYTVFFQKNSDAAAYNLYTLVNFGVFPAYKFSKPSEYLTKRIKTKIGGDTYSCGVEYYVRSLDSFTKFYSSFLRKRRWNFGSGVLEQDANTILTREYVPGEATAETSLNKILKNNFGPGSYLLEHFDVKKQQTRVFIENTSALSKLSEDIHKDVGLKIASVSDRLGNIILQFPSTLLRCQFNPSGDYQSLNLAIKTAPGFNFGNTLKAIGMSECERGKYLHDFAMGGATPPAGNLSVDQTSGTHCYYLIEATTNTILSSFKGVYLEGLSVQLNLVQPEPRIVETSCGTKRVQLSSPSQGLSVSAGTSHTKEYWESERIFSEERKELEEAIAFKQYGATSGHDREEAIKDIEALMHKYGEHGVWLWDPFLSAQDIIDTLFLSTSHHSDLRAVGSNQGATLPKAPVPTLNAPTIWERLINWACGPRGERGHPDFKKWKEQERDKLAWQSKQAKVGLRLEFRAQHGTHGYKFHDRFLLFPGKGSRSRVWALGTSLNSIGKHHHIIQEVSHPEYVVQAFTRLWDDLNSPECLVWKSW